MDNIDRRSRARLACTAARSWAARRPGSASLALASLLDPALLRGAERESGPTAPRDSPDAGTGRSARCHFAPKVKRIIYLYMAGGPSHLETLDYKPTLAKMHGQPMPESFTTGMPIAQLQGQSSSASPPSTRSSGAGQAARRSARSSRTWPRSPTRSASSARW